MASGTIGAQTLAAGDTGVVDVAASFSDPDGDALSFSAVSDAPRVVSASVAGSVVTVVAVRKGEANITVTARDPGGLSATLAFMVRVPNRAPMIADSVPEQLVFVGDTARLDLAAHFTDPDGDTLAYGVASDSAGAASISLSGSVVTVVGLAEGSTTVTASASDPEGLSAELEFAVRVPNRAPVVTDSVPEQSLFVSDTVRVDLAAHVADPDGDELTYEASSSASATASVSVAGSVVTVVGVSQGVASVTVTARDPGGMAVEFEFAVRVPNRAPVVTDSVPEQSLFVGDTVQVNLAAHVADPDGDELTYEASSSASATASVSVAGSVVAVVGVSQGAASVTVTARDPGGMAVEFDFAVRVPNREPVVTDSVPEQSLFVGDTVEVNLAPLFTDPDGDTLVHMATSADTSVVAVVVSGNVMVMDGRAEGTSVVTVTAADAGNLGATLSFGVTVESAEGRIVISGVEPSVLTEGQSARILGSGFSAFAAQNAVSLGGRIARVSAATEEAITFVVPRAECLPPRHEELVVAVEDRRGAREVGVTPRTQGDMEIEVGWYWYTSAGNGCLHLGGDASGQHYVIGVVSTSENADLLTGVNLVGTPGDAAVLRAAAAPAVAGMESGGAAMRAAIAQGPQTTIPARLSGPASTGEDGLLHQIIGDTLSRRGARVHNEVMARNLALLEQVGRQSPPALADAQRQWQVGDIVSMYANRPRLCTNTEQVQAVVRWIGSSSIWLDDLANPGPSFTQAELAELDAFYAANGAGVHSQYFGRLTDVDNNGRIVVLMTKEVNRVDNLQGYVWGLDLVPRILCPSSNQAEMYYGKVPDPEGLVGRAVTKEALLQSYKPLLVHEVTHIVQFGAFLYGDATLKTGWEAEGAAVLAEQLVGYRVAGLGSGQDIGFRALRDNLEWNDWFLETAVFFGFSGSGREERAPEECSWVGVSDSEPCIWGGRAIYGVPSMVFRYAMDRWGDGYRGGERALMRRLTNAPKRGFASLVDVSPNSSWRREEILADFYISLWSDMHGRKTQGMSSWDLHEIFQESPEQMRLKPYTSSSREPRLRGRRVRAGSSLFLYWTPGGAVSPTSIRVTRTSGRPVPNHISVWAYRVR